MIISYVFFNIINVILQTVKSILTIKGNKWVASIVNAVAYGLYTYLLVLIASDINLWVKILGCAGANLIGVFVVKWFEEKREKEKLWKIEATFKADQNELLDILEEIDYNEISNNAIILDDGYTIINFYAKSKKESKTAKQIIDKYNGKYFVTESKTLS